MTDGIVRRKYSLKYTLERALNQGAALAHRPRAEYTSKFHAGEIWCSSCRQYHPMKDMIRRRKKTTGYDNICKKRAIVRATLCQIKTGRIRTTTNPTVLRMLREEQIRVERTQSEAKPEGSGLQGEEERTPADSRPYWRPVDSRAAG